MARATATRRAFVSSLLLGAASLATLGLAGCAETSTIDGVSYAPNGKDAYKAAGYEGEPSSVAIADEVEGLPVTAIGPGAFEGCASLSSARPGAKTRFIEDRAFKGCTSLRDMTFSGALQKIGRSAFEGCAALAELSAGASLGSVGQRAFADCASLRSVELAGCYYLGEGAFEGCASLETVRVAANLCNVKGGAFAGCSSLTSFTSEGDARTVEIAAHAFDGCPALTAVEFRGPVVIEKDAFAGCESLSSIVVGPESTVAEGAVPPGCEVVEYVDESKSGEVERIETTGAGTGWTSNVTQQANATAQSMARPDADETVADDETDAAADDETDAESSPGQSAEGLDPWKH